MSGTDCCVCKEKTAYELRISDWSSDVCSSDLGAGGAGGGAGVSTGGGSSNTTGGGSGGGGIGVGCGGPSSLISLGSPQVAGGGPPDARSEVRRVGHEGGCTCRFREWSRTCNKNRTKRNSPT